MDELGLHFDARTFENSLELFVMQPTPFCNIDCDYCYLRNRQSTEIMSVEVLEAAFRRISESIFTGKEVTVAWHAGEPLTVPISFYRDAVSIARRFTMSHGKTVRHNIQTNATLLSPSWCEFFKEHDFSIGVSIDGPETIHNRHRKRRSGEGTFQAVMKGIEMLKKHEIRFHTICVLTKDSLASPDEMFSFFSDLGAYQVGFNIEETEGPNVSSLRSGDAQMKLRRFIRRIFEIWVDNYKTPRIREFDGLISAMKYWEKGVDHFSQESVPFKIINVDVNGDFSTFSPELLGHQTKFGAFVFGNVLRDSFESCLNSPQFASVYQEMLSGINNCRRSCPYFCLCGGGNASNKYFETGSFDSTVTTHCKNTKQAFIDEIFAVLERQLSLPPFASSA